MRKLIYLGTLLFSILYLSSFVSFAQDTETKTQSSSDSEPKKPKTYTEKYREFYNPKNYTKNYKERFKGKNYREHCREIHQENMDSFKNAPKYINQIYQGTYDLWQQAKHPVPEAAEIFNRDKYGRKVDRDLKLDDGPIFGDIYAYRNFQYRKRGYDIDYYSRGNTTTYRDPNLWSPDPRLSTKHGEFLDDPLMQAYYNRGTKQTSLPTSNVINLPQPQPFQSPGSAYFTPYNPFMTYPDLTPPHLSNPVNSSIQLEEDAPTTDDLQDAETTKDKPEDKTDSPDIVDSEIQDTPGAQNQQRMKPLNRMRRQTPQSPAQLLYNQGMKSISQRNYSKASQQFEQLISVNPSSSYVHFALGISLFLSGDYTESLKSLHHSEQLSSKQTTPPPNVWQLPIKTNDFQAYFRKLARYVEQNSNNREAKELLYAISRISSYPPDRIR